MRRIAAKFVPRLLNNEQRDHQVQLCTELQEAARHDPNFLSRVITGDDHGCMFMSHYDNSSWNFIKSLRKPTLVSPPLRWRHQPKKERQKATVFAKHLMDVLRCAVGRRYAKSSLKILNKSC